MIPTVRSSPEPLARAIVIGRVESKRLTWSATALQTKWTSKY